MADLESIRLDPYSEAHKRIVELLVNCKKWSKDQITQRYDNWQRIDKQHRSYIDVSETDEKGRKMNPFERQVYIPMSRAIFDTWMTYILQTVCGRRPMFPIDGRGPEDVKSAKLMENIVDYQMEQQGFTLKLYRFGSDVGKYGFGCIKDLWTRETSTIMEMVPTISMESWPPVVVNRRVPREIISYEGPELVNVDPYTYFPDLRVPLGELKERQFTGYQYGRSKHQLLKRAREGIYYNIEQLDRFVSPGLYEHDSQEGRENTLKLSKTYQNYALDKKNPHFKVDEFWIEIIPRDYFGEEYPAWPQIWAFAMVEEALIIRSEKSGYIHNTFPEIVAELDPDGYTMFNPGLYEDLLPLQNLMNWFYNSHVDNVRRFLNNMVIYDPRYIETRDITRPTPAKVIRATKDFDAQNMRLQDVIQQLPFMDITGGHLRDANLIADMMQRRAATPDTIQGIETEVKRTATEIAKSASQATSRLGMFVMLMFTQGLMPLVAQMVQNNQQFLSERRFYKIVGEYPQEIGIEPDELGFLEAGPEDIQGQFNYPVFDGRLPIQPEQRAEIIIEGLKVASKIPTVGQVYDLAGLYARAFQDLGVKDIDRFRLKAQVLPDEQIARMGEAGDAIPLDQYRKGMQVA